MNAKNRNEWLSPEYQIKQAEEQLVYIRNDIKNAESDGNTNWLNRSKEIENLETSIKDYSHLLFTTYADTFSVINSNLPLMYGNPNLTEVNGLIYMVITSILAYIIAYINFTKKDILIYPHIKKVINIAHCLISNNVDNFLF